MDTYDWKEPDLFSAPVGRKPAKRQTTEKADSMRVGAVVVVALSARPAFGMADEVEEAFIDRIAAVRVDQYGARVTEVESGLDIHDSTSSDTPVWRVYTLAGSGAPGTCVAARKAWKAKSGCAFKSMAEVREALTPYYTKATK